MNQFLRCVGKIRAAEHSGDDPARYVAQARQWLAIVKLTNPQDAAELERELQATAIPRPRLPNGKPIAWDWPLFALRLAWIGVPFAFLFMLAGPTLIVQIFAGIALVWLLVFIFLK